MTEDRIVEYVKGGKSLFTISMISLIRDGGTGVLHTTIGDFFIHQDTKRFHSAYPPSDQNLITDDLLIEYLIHRIEDYIENREKQVERDRHLLNTLQSNYHQQTHK